jgi:hypothetical protein
VQGGFAGLHASFVIWPQTSIGYQLQRLSSDQPPGLRRPPIQVVGPPLAGGCRGKPMVLRISDDLLPVTISAPLTLAHRLAAHRMAGWKPRRLKGLLAVAAAFPIAILSHCGPVLRNR